MPPNLGDALSLAAAGASALFILRLETFARVTEPKALNAVSTLTVAVLCVPWALAEAVLGAPSAVHAGPVMDLAAFSCSEAFRRAAGMAQEHLPALLYLGVVTTAFTNWLQTIGQRHVPATTASAIYALDPLWGCLFAYIWLGEALGPQGIAGCGVLLAVWLYQLACPAEPAGGAASSRRARRPVAGEAGDGD